MPYIERQHLPYSALQMFDLVADVERYPEFLPWVIESRIRDRKDQTVFVDMTITFGPLRKRFSSAGILHCPYRIDIVSNDPLFERFAQRWIFEPATQGGTNVEYRVEVGFRSRALEMLMGLALADRAAGTVSAFRRRAARLYRGAS